MDMGLGPQPFVQCTVRPTETPANATLEQKLRSAERAIAAARAAAAAAKAVDLANARGTVALEPQVADPAGSSDRIASSSSSSSGGGGSVETGEEGTCSALREQVATWIILPDSTPEEVAQQLKTIGKHLWGGG
jgi:hypothetical protein